MDIPLYYYQMSDLLIPLWNQYQIEMYSIKFDSDSSVESIFKFVIWVTNSERIIKFYTIFY